jgi:hypothetical protein
MLTAHITVVQYPINALPNSTATNNPSSTQMGKLIKTIAANKMSLMK